MESNCFKQFVLVIFVVFCVRAGDSTAYAKNRQHSIVVTLSTDRRNYTVGQNISVRCGIRNVDVEPFYVSPYLDFISRPIYGFAVSILDTNGRDRCSRSCCRRSGTGLREEPGHYCRDSKRLAATPRVFLGTRSDPFVRAYEAGQIYAHRNLSL
jgi:hypothetical protein